MLASALMTGCTPAGDVIDADYAKVCQDKSTKMRADDSKCSNQGRGSTLYGWYFIATNTDKRVPPIGEKLSGGVTSIPKTATSKSGVSGKGIGTVSRGGFGGSHGSNGG